MVTPWAMPAGLKNRTAIDHLELCFGDGGDAVARSMRMETDKNLEKSNAWKVHGGIADVPNAFVLRDQLAAVVNTEGLERLCRWGYGLEVAHEDVSEENHWKGGGSELRTRWDLLGEYHPTEAGWRNRIETADEEAEDKLRREALFKKYLAKARG